MLQSHESGVPTNRIPYGSKVVLGAVGAVDVTPFSDDSAQALSVRLLEPDAITSIVNAPLLQ